MTPSPRLRRLVARAAGVVVLLLTTSGCTVPSFGFPDPITVQGHRVLGLWKGSVFASLGVGALVGGMIIWACFRFRKKGDELPRQVHYNVPIEVLYTVIPFVIIAVLFYFTAVDENYENKLSAKPDVVVNVIGFKWAWQFQYPASNLTVTGRPGQYPTLVVPTHKKILFVETSPDVIHAFWVPEFLFKRDVIPGRENRFEVTVDKEGTFRGRCSELCGTYHSRMLFTLKSVSWTAYQQFLATATAQAKAGTNDMFTTSSGSGT